MHRNLESHREATDWNVLTSFWLEALDMRGELRVHSPLKVLQQAGQLRRLAAASPLDLFAAYRFLLTLLYWKADEAGGAEAVRKSLLKGSVPDKVLKALSAEDCHFALFDPKKPFLQDPDVASEKKHKSAGSFFAEFACGTNVAHFHHGDDERARLCLKCATVGLLRVVPWTQSGGAGLFPALHGAPPLMSLAFGENLAHTLGLNLIPLENAGTPKWSGHFAPKKPAAPVPYMEAFTWNSRRIHLLEPQPNQVCWRCGQADVMAVGPIVYAKNDQVKKPSDKQPFQWEDPAAFYISDTPFTTTKSSKENMAAQGTDLANLLDGLAPLNSAVVKLNQDVCNWLVVIPCTNPANNKTFDHRQLELRGKWAEALAASVPAKTAPVAPPIIEGWRVPREAPSRGETLFVRAAVAWLSHADWAELLSAAFREMHESPAAFDLFSGVFWSLRQRKVAGLPKRNVGWLVMKLMAAVPANARVVRAKATFSPLGRLEKRESAARGVKKTKLRYPISLPAGKGLEAMLRNKLEAHLRQRNPEPIAWARLCAELNQLLG